MTSGSSQRAFTLIEMLTVMLVIAILAGIILSVYNLAQTKAGRSRADGEIQTLTLGIENYKADNGTVPRNANDTDALDPRKSGSPSQYAAACKYLYIALSGDTDPQDHPDMVIGPKDGKSYLPEFFKPQVLNLSKDGAGNVKEVNYIQDPFGNSYGYSTAGAADEETYRNAVRFDPKAIRQTTTRGFNTTFDLWSTAGLLKTPPTDQDRAKWVKNW